MTGVLSTPPSDRVSTGASSIFPLDSVDVETFPTSLSGCITAEVPDTQVPSTSVLSSPTMALMPATSSSDTASADPGLLDNSVDPELPSVAGSNALSSTAVDWDLSEAFDWLFQLHYIEFLILVFLPRVCLFVMLLNGLRFLLWLSTRFSLCLPCLCRLSLLFRRRFPSQS
jgi:hypothetical protein